MKILIIGEARSGKDTLAEIWNKRFGLKYQSSSMAAAERFIFEKLKDEKCYSTVQECYDDRVNNRIIWYDLITEYNENDRTKLAKDILKDNDCYVGMRNIHELEQCRKEGLFDIIIWVDAQARMGGESNKSCTVMKKHADIIIKNNGTLEQFEDKANRLGLLFFL